jgi:hypothetical protein
LVSGRRGERQSKEVSKTTHEKEIAIIIAITAISIIAHPLTTPKPGAASLYWMMKGRCAEHVRQSIPSIRVQNKTIEDGEELSRQEPNVVADVVVDNRHSRGF